MKYNALLIFNLFLLLSGSVFAQEQKQNYDDLFYIPTDAAHAGFITRAGELAIKYDYPLSLWFCSHFFCDGVAEVSLPFKRGECEDPYEFINTSGDVVIKGCGVSFGFSEGLLRVSDGGRNAWVGFMDTTGKFVIPPIYDDAGSFHEGLARVTYKGRDGFIDKSGRFVIAPKFALATDFSEGLAQIRKHGKYGFIDRTGQIVIAPQFEDVEDFSEGLAEIMYKDKPAFIDRTGKIVIETKYDGVNKFSDGLARFLMNKKHGFIDKTGKVVIQPIYDFADDFSEGLSVVGKNYYQSSYIDKTGAVAFAGQQFYSASSFDRGLARVRIKVGEDSVNNNYIVKDAYIDKTGKIIWREK